MPPPMDSLRLLQSTVANSGWLATAANSVLTAGKEWNVSPRSAPSSALTSRGLGMRMLQPPRCSPSSMLVVKLKMWYSGSEHTTVKDAPGGSWRSAGWFHVAHCRMLATRLACESMTPLDTPVVPPVYCSTARSVGARSRGASNARRAPAATAALKRTAPGSAKRGTSLRTWRTTRSTTPPLSQPSDSPMDASSTCGRGGGGGGGAPAPACGGGGGASSTACSVAAKFSRITTALAPLSASACASSRAVYSGLTLTTTSPARSAAATATGYCGTLGSMMATRSPRARPRPCRYAASARDCASTAAYVVVAPMNLNALRSA